LVGVLQADSELYISDFRSAERSYQLLMDAVDLASPALAGGRVIIQTRFPTHHAVQAVLSGNPDRFYQEELEARRLLNYPPMCHLAELSVTGTTRELVEEAAKQWAMDLGQIGSDQESLVVLGPVQAISTRIRHHHQRMLVKATELRTLSRRLHESVRVLERKYQKGRIKFAIDIDPVETGQG
jgi:primosomal protein N' (replication factor Y)